MKVGMLWFDDSPKSISDRVKRAVEFYSEKYGQQPTLCLVNPEMLDAEEGVIAGIQIRRARLIMPGHFWIGIDDNADGKQVSSPSKTRAKRSAKAEIAA
jgi:hypothetical protein